MKYQLNCKIDFSVVYDVKKAEQIFFTDEVAPKEAKLTDLSNDRDGSVVGWMNEDGVYKVSTQTKGQKVIFNEECNKMLHERLSPTIKSVSFKNVDTSNGRRNSGRPKLRETRSQRVVLLLRPSFYEVVRKRADEMDVSVNELYEKIMKEYLENSDD